MSILPVPPIPLNTRLGIKAINARNMAPKSVILFDILPKYSLVCLPALIPGINPPFCYILLLTSSGLNVIFE